jgi:oxygen-independent coproporphyrinogen-3 oxidase
MSYSVPDSEPNYKALYIHIPFCKSRCYYCDFTTEAIGFDDPRIDAHIDGLVEALQIAHARAQLREIQTVYIGGGTPSFIGAKRLARLFKTLALSLEESQLSEFTVELNPDSVDEPLLELLAESQVNRISLGVQSLADSELSAIGRAHNSASAKAALQSLLPVIGNVSVDMICGLPGQSEQSFLTSLSELLQFDVSHISVYPLSIEDGTPLAAAYEAGTLMVADDDEQAEMLLAAKQLLASKGFTHYEIASYAKPGFESRHNSAYWTALPYLGLGRGAVGMAYLGGKRIRFDEQGVIEELDTREQAAEDLMLGLRLLEGVPEQLVLKTSQVLASTIECLNSLVLQGLLEHSDGYYRLTASSWLLANQTFGQIWSLAESETSQ